MRVYTVHQPPMIEDDDEPVLIKEGFAWWALFAPLLWALYHRLWGMAFAVLVATAVLEGVLTLIGVDPVGHAVATVGLSWLFAALGNDWRRRTLERRGYRMAGVVAAPDVAAAEMRWFAAG